MASQDSNNNDLAYADTLWKSADALRGQIDAAEYKHVVLGLLFLKYISDAFAARREGLMAELEADGINGAQMESLLESRDEYTAERVFWVPPEARWQNLQNQATRPDIATLIDDAILAVERDNPNLKGKLPRDYARRSIAPEKLKGLIDLIADIGFKGDRAKARDSLGRVYEYFLGKFAQAEGKLGGEFFTPRCIVRLLVEMLEPYEGRVYDPCCGSAGMFVQSERFVEAHGGQTTDISIFGQESNPTTWRLAHMNLAIRGIEANLGAQPADTFLRDLHPDLKADYILANPPFNISDWSGRLLEKDVRWRYGTPPAGNANYAWIQHFIHHLAPPNGHGGGVAGFVMANGSLSSGSGGEGEIRQRIVEADLVDAIVALPAQLFLTTGIPACLWFLTRDKTGRNLKHGGPHRKEGRRGETLFIDARKLGTLQTRTLRVLTGGDDGETLLADGLGDPRPDSDIGRIVCAFRQWRGEPAPAWWDTAEHGDWTYRDIPGFCKAETLDGIRKHGFVLTPGRYVGAEEQEEDSEPFEEKYPRLLAELDACFMEGERLMGRVRNLLWKVGSGDEWVPFTELLSHIVDNRGRTCPTDADGLPLIATNCISNERLYPSYDTTRWVSEATYQTWFRSHPIPGDLIFVCKGSPGRVCMVPDPVNFCIAQDMVAVRPESTKVDPKYLFAVLRSSLVQARIANMHVGTLIPHFKKGDFNKLTIPLPDALIQRGIGNLYFEISAKIESNTRTAQAVERLTRAIFRAWFVDFEPVKAKAAGATAFPSMPQPVFDALPTGFVDSEIGPVPEGWEVFQHRVAELEAQGALSVGDGYRAKRSELADSGLPFIRAGNVNGNVNTEGAELLCAESAAKAGPKRSRVWETVFTSKGTVGRIGLITPWTGDVVYSPQVCYWRSLDERTIDPFFLHLWICSVSFTDQWMAVKGNTDMADFVSLSDQRAMRLAVPTLSLQSALRSIVEPLFRLKAETDFESRKLAEMRDYLLPKLLSGELRVNDAATTTEGLP